MLIFMNNWYNGIGYKFNLKINYCLKSKGDNNE